MHVETVVLLSQRKADDYVEVELELDEMDLTLAENAATSKVIKGNMQILALERSGLVLQAGIDANESIESQGYAISSLGRMVDRFAISLESEERQSFYKQKSEKHNLEVDLPTASAEDIQKLFE